jgi:acylphosphatase
VSSKELKLATARINVKNVAEAASKVEGPMRYKHYLISGKVQGVSYRRFAEHSANSIGVRGVTRNLRDGRVEVLAAGEESELADFEVQLHRGPALSRVEGVQAKEITEPQFKSLASVTSFEVAETADNAWQL